MPFLLCRELLPFLSILQVQTPGKGVEWPSQVYTGSLRQAANTTFPNGTSNSWLKYFPSSQSFSFSSCVLKPCGEWGMSSGVLLTHCTASPGRSCSASAAIPGAPWELMGTLPWAPAKPGFYLHHAALPHSLSNVWTNWGINSVLMLLGKNWKLSFCQTRIYFQLYLKGAQPNRSGPLSNKVYANGFNFY